MDIAGILNKSTEVDLELLVVEETLKPSEAKEEPVEVENSSHISIKVDTEPLVVDETPEPTNTESEFVVETNGNAKSISSSSSSRSVYSCHSFSNQEVEYCC